MVRSTGLLLIFTFCCTTSLGQVFEKVWFDRLDTVYGFYTVIEPIHPAVGALILFDGFGGNSVSLLSETGIPKHAKNANLLTVCIPVGSRLFLDDQYAQQIAKILNKVASNHSFSQANYAIGGFSVGGSIALRYAELSYQHRDRFAIRPAAVFSVDSPVDLLELYRLSKQTLKVGKRHEGKSEAERIVSAFLEMSIGFANFLTERITMWKSSGNLKTDT